MTNTQETTAVTDAFDISLESLILEAFEQVKVAQRFANAVASTSALNIRTELKPLNARLDRMFDDVVTVGRPAPDRYLVLTTLLTAAHLAERARCVYAAKRTIVRD